jgi:hypothetical protein
MIVIGCAIWGVVAGLGALGQVVSGHHPAPAATAPARPAAPAPYPSPAALTCGAQTTTATIGDMIRGLTADDRAIGGDWAGAQQATTEPTETAAQTKALADLAGLAQISRTDAAASGGPLAARIGTLASDADDLPGGLNDAGPAVHRDILAMARLCGAS